MPAPKRVPGTDRVKATEARNEALARKERARVRAGIYDRDIIKLLSFGVSAEMLGQILDPDNDLRPRTAKEAAEIAKIALEIGRREMGEGDPTPENMTDEQRHAKVSKVAELLALAQERGEQLAASGGRPVAVPDPEPDAS